MDRLQEGIRHGITFGDYTMFGHDRGESMKTWRTNLTANDEYLGIR